MSDKEDLRKNGTKRKWISPRLEILNIVKNTLATSGFGADGGNVQSSTHGFAS